ncbi:MAG: ACT domain-containing protein [Promethearchaeota archaeon]
MLKQISVFLDNAPGELAKFTKILMEEGINLRAITVAETADFGILRILVDNVEECMKILKDANYLVSLTDVIAVEVPDRPGGLHEITKILGDAHINIEYVYSTLLKEEAMIILRVDDVEKAMRILKDEGVKLVEKQEF